MALEHRAVIVSPCPTRRRAESTSPAARRAVIPALNSRSRPGPTSFFRVLELENAVVNGAPFLDRRTSCPKQPGPIQAQRYAPLIGAGSSVTEWSGRSAANASVSHRFEGPAPGNYSGLRKRRYSAKIGA